MIKYRVLFFQPLPILVPSLALFPGRIAAAAAIFVIDDEYKLRTMIILS
jgi:hypothetical protein